MIPRGRWQGMLTILRFNWPLYLAAGVVVIVALAGLVSLVQVHWRILCASAGLGAGYFLLVSLGVSHWVYDCSDLYRFHWLDRALADARMDRIVLCHSGFDETSELLKARLQPGQWITLDHYDPRMMTEDSIQRARRSSQPTEGTLSAPFDHWPVQSSSVDVVFALLAIHEFRSGQERTRWFAEAKRCLSPGGRIVLAEHLRDPANFIAFGPGFLHFHSRSSWQRCWEGAGLHLVDKFTLTPWVHLFVLDSP